jgi:VCBS repeat-containing protein
MLRSLDNFALASANSISIGSGANSGTVTLDAAGNVNFTSDTNFDSLAEGESVFIGNVTYVIRMANGAFSVTTAAINITGDNDAPVAVADSNNVTEDSTSNPINGNVLTNDTDVDTLDTHSVTAVNGSASNVGQDVAGTYGTLHLNSNGTYTYTLDNSKAAVQALADGQTVTDVFSYTNSDNHGATSDANLTISVHGANDDPVAVADSNDVTEDSASNPVNGNVLPNDTEVDTLDTHSVTAVNGLASNVGQDVAGTTARCT